MATIEECAAAFRDLADKLASADADIQSKTGFDRTLSCTLRDLHTTFAGRLHDGQLTEIRQDGEAQAQIRLAMSSDDLLTLVAGELNIAAAWASGRLEVEAGMLDLLKLRTLL